MSINEKLLNLLCCPNTKIPLKILPNEKMELLNDNDLEVDIVHSLSGLLITENGKIIYRIENGIPNLLSEEGFNSNKNISPNND